MITYHKIQTVFKRDMEGGGKTLLEGQYSIPEFEYLKDNEWVFTEKVDGTNIRIMWDGPGKPVRFGGKTDNANLPSRLVDYLREMFPDNSEMAKTFTGPVCLYGEGYGAGIQKGGSYGQDQRFVLFDVNIEGWWLHREDVEEIAAGLNMDIVPIMMRGTLSEAVEMVRHGMRSSWGDFNSEGLVGRPTTELFTRGGNRIITKIKHRDFTNG